MTIVRLLADDLTGALDSAAQFTGAIGPLPVYVRTRAAPKGGAALDLACRDRTEEEAMAKTRAATSWLTGADIAFKKIDSLLRGHWAAELAVLHATGAFRRVILAPAFPAQGRVTQEGRQYLRGADGCWSRLPRDPALMLAEHGIAVAHGLATGDAGATWLRLCDAKTEADLAALADAGQRMDGPTLWCGAAGLAQALAGAGPRPTCPSPGPHLVVVGSNHAVTHGQMAALEAEAPGRIVRFDADVLGSAERINRCLADAGGCVTIADLPTAIEPHAAAAQIARWLGATMPHLVPPANLTVVGGETFAAVCDALGVDHLAVVGEWRPGIPSSRIVGPRWSDTLCFSKSGAFGDPRFLIDMAGQR